MNRSAWGKGEVKLWKKNGDQWSVINSLEAAASKKRNPNVGVSDYGFSSSVSRDHPWGFVPDILLTLG